MFLGQYEYPLALISAFSFDYFSILFILLNLYVYSDQLALLACTVVTTLAAAYANANAAQAASSVEVFCASNL